jgi:delta-aminolevulinic acid dehydratase/porphobilinogen synthase
MVPTVLLTKEGVKLQIPDHELTHVGQITAITAALQKLRETHSVDGSWILVVDPALPYADMIRAIDAASAAKYPHFVVGAGA